MSISVQPVNDNLERFYADFIRPPRKKILMTPLALLESDQNLYRCSMIYRVLLKRYPDLSANLSLGRSHGYLAKKIQEIQRSTEYRGITAKRSAMFAEGSGTLRIFSDSGAMICTIHMAGVSTPQKRLDTLFHSDHLVRLSQLFFDMNVFPTDVAIINNFFYVLEAHAKTESHTLRDIFMALESEWLSYTLNDFNYTKIIHPYIPEAPNSYEWSLLQENVENSRILDNAALQSRGVFDPGNFASCATAHRHSLVAVHAGEIETVIMVIVVSFESSSSTSTSTNIRNEAHFSDESFKTFLIKLLPVQQSLEKENININKNDCAFVNFVFYRQLVGCVYLSLNSCGKCITRENTVIRVADLQEWMQLSTESVPRGSDSIEASEGRSSFSVIENVLDIMSTHVVRLSSIFYLRDRLPYVTFVIRQPEWLVQMGYQSILGRKAEPAAVALQSESFYKKLSACGSAYHKFTYMYDLLHELLHSKEYNDNLEVDSAVFNHIMSATSMRTPTSSGGSDDKRTRIKYYGCFGTSGYAICCKLIVWALHMQGADIQFVMLDNYHQAPELNKYDELLIKLSVNVLAKYDIVVVHSVPTLWDKIRLYERARNPNMTMYGITVWETERIPKNWIEPMARMNVISCPCDYNKRVFEVDVKGPPVETVHHPIVLLCEGKENKQHMDVIFREHGVTDSTYKFYTINEYNGRKGISDLIRIYAETFEHEDDVFLYIKTSCHQSREEISAYLDKLHVALGKKLPKMSIDIIILSEEEITAVHSMNDCFVSLTKGEGTGYTSCQAALLGKPIIISRYSATPEYIKSAFFVDVEMHPTIYCDRVFAKHRNCGTRCVFNPNYDSSFQTWGIPVAEQVKQRMRYCFEQKIRQGDPDTASYIREHFSLENVGRQFLDSLKRAVELGSDKALSVDSGVEPVAPAGDNKSDVHFALPSIFGHIFKPHIDCDHTTVNLKFE